MEEGEERMNGSCGCNKINGHKKKDTHGTDDEKRIKCVNSDVCGKAVSMEKTTVLMN